MIRALHMLISGLLIANFAAQILAAQKTRAPDYKVEGRVTDWVTGNAIVAATVAAEDSHKHSYPTLTKADGRYRLEHLPREDKLTLSCSQLGYSPNPMQSVITIRSGTGKWDTRLFQENGDALYMKAAAGRLAALTGPDSVTAARFVADNVDANSKKIIAAELQEKMRAVGRRSDLSQIALVFQYFADQQPVGEGKVRTVAVLDFGYAAVMNSVQAVFGSNQDVGRGMSDLLINQLVNDGRYRVIERRAIDKILKEQNFSNSDLVSAPTAAKIGSLLGVDAIIIGDVTQFGRDDKHYSGGGGGGSIWSAGGGSLGTSKSQAVVEVTARVVDVSTGEILASVTGHGESQRSGLTSSGSGFAGWKGGGGQLDMASTNFSQSILGQAVKQAVDDTAKGLDSDAASLSVNGPPPADSIDGLVADATGGQITINVGSNAGVHVGDKLAISRVIRSVKDPATGKVLRTIELPVGMLTITSVDSGSAVGKLDGAGTPKVGDAVRRPK